MTSFIPILMYHALWPPLEGESLARHWAADPQLADPGSRLYALDVREFERQLELLRDAGAGRSPLAWTSFDAVGPRPGPVVSFDDGHHSNHSLALPALTQRGLRAIFFITTDWIGCPGFMTEGQIRELAAAGMLIGAHGCTHRYLSDLADGEISDELARSKTRLEAILDAEVPALALPGGRGDARVRRLAARAGYRLMFTSRIGLAAPGEDALDLPRVPITNRQDEQFLARLLAGDDRDLRAMARSARLRGAARALLGNRLYDRLRAGLMR